MKNPILSIVDTRPKISSFDKCLELLIKSNADNLDFMKINSKLEIENMKLSLTINNQLDVIAMYEKEIERLEQMK